MTDVRKTGLVCRFCGKEVEETIEMSDGWCTITALCDCTYMGEPIASRWSFSKEHMQRFTDADKTKERFERLQNAIQECKGLEAEHNARFRNEEEVNYNFENNRFSTSPYGRRAIGAYGADLEVTFDERSSLLRVMVNDEYDFAFDEDVVRDLKKLLENYLEMMGSKRVNE